MSQRQTERSHSEAEDFTMLPSTAADKKVVAASARGARALAPAGGGARGARGGAPLARPWRKPAKAHLQPRPKCPLRPLI